ncbi:MAG: HVA1 family protein [Litorimonas sp.]
MAGYDKGTKVEWDWGNGTGTGTITETFTDEVTRTLKGNEVTRKASSDEPAYLIEQEDGDEVLKSHSEVTKA